MRTALLAVAALLLLPVDAALAKGGGSGGGARIAPPENLEDLFHRAFYQESGLRDFEAAEALYAQAAALAREADREDLLVKSLLGRARCLRTMGRTDEAAPLFGQVLEIDPENAEAKEATAGKGDRDLHDRIRTLVDLLGGPQAEIGKRDLRLIGDRAVPALREALRRPEAGIVQIASYLLLEMKTPASFDALAGALGDESVAYPQVVRQAALSQETFTSLSSLPLMEGLLKCPDPMVRVQAIEQFRKKGARGDLPLESVTSIARRGLEDPDPRVRTAVLFGQWPSEGLLLMRERILKSYQSSEPRERWGAFAMMCESGVAGAFREELRGALEDPKPVYRTWAFRSLLLDELVPVEEAEAIAVRFLRSGEPTQVGAAVTYLRSRKDWAEVPIRAEFLQAILDAEADRYRSGKAPTSEHVVDSSPVLANLPLELLDRLPTGGLVDLFAVARKAGALEGRKILTILQNRTREDPVAPAAMAGIGLARIRDRDGRAEWLLWWSGVADLGVAETAVADPDPRVRMLGYRVLLEKFWWKWPVGVRLPHLAEDFGSDLDTIGEKKFTEDLGTLAVALAVISPDPSYGPPLERVAAAATDPARRERAYAALVRCAGKDAVPALRAALGNWKQVGFSTHVRDYLAGLIGEECVPDLLGVIHGGLGASGALGGFRPRSPTAENPLGHRNLQATSPGPASERTQAIVDAVLEQLGPDVLDLQLLHAVGNLVSPPVRARLVRRALESGSAGLTIQGARTAATFLVEGAWPYLLPHLQNPDPSVRKEAEVALKSIRETRELRESFRRFDEEDSAEALEAAKALLASEDPVKRKGGALALGALGDPAAVAALLPLLDDTEASVRDAALSALEKLGGK